MANPTPAEATNISRNGDSTLEWSAVRGELDTLSTGPEVITFLGTTSPQRRPHSTGIGPIWKDGHYYFVSGLDALEARNLAMNPRCTISTRLPSFDLVLDGTAKRVDDAATIAEVAKQFYAGGWPAYPEGGGLNAPFMAPSAGPPP